MKKLDCAIGKPSVRQLLQLIKPRAGFSNPQEGRVYSIFGVAPTIRNDSRYYVLLVDKKENY